VSLWKAASYAISSRLSFLTIRGPRSEKVQREPGVDFLPLPAWVR
jgi:hypothetical protein